MNEFIKYIIKKNYSKNTIYSYRYVLKEFEEFLGGKSITFNQVSKYLKFQAQRNHKAATIQFKKHVLLSYLKFLKVKYLDQVEDIKIPCATNYFFNVLDKKFFLEKMETITNKEHRDLFYLMYYTGIRISELKTITTDQNQKNILVFGKGLKYRNIPIHKIISNINFEICKTYTKKRIYKLIRDYWPSWVTAHTFRRSFCTNLIKNGANIKIVSMVMGHARIETTAKYINFNNNDIVNELEKYS